mgnify:CR=1 FL=1
MYKPNYTDRPPIKPVDAAAVSPELARYHRQMLLPGFGEAGQRRLLGSTALLLGCGVLVATHRIPHPPIDLVVPSLRAVLPDSCDLIAVLPWGVLAARMPARPVDLAGVERLTQQWHRKAEP